jgi:hypothetical protein
MINAAGANLAAVTDKTIVIPGHNWPDQASGQQQIGTLSYRDMLVAIRGSVAKLKADGRSLDEIVAAKPTAAFDAKWGQFLITPALFTKLVYEDVWREGETTASIRASITVGRSRRRTRPVRRSEAREAQLTEGFQIFSGLKLTIIGPAKPWGGPRLSRLRRSLGLQGRNGRSKPHISQ